MNTCCVVRSSRPAGLFSFGLLDGLQVRLRQPHVREAPASFGLERLATAFMNNPGEEHSSTASPEYLAGRTKQSRQYTEFVQMFQQNARSVY